MTGNKTVYKITKVSRNLSHNSLGTVTNEAEDIEHDKERYISPGKTGKIIDDLKLI